MKTQTKVFIGLGIASAIGIGAFLYSRSKKAEPKLTADVVAPAEPVLDTKKELTQSDANALAQKVFEIKNMEMSSKFSKGYNSPATALLQQLKDADYTYVKKVNPTKTGSFEYGAAIKNGSKEAKDIPVQKTDLERQKEILVEQKKGLLELLAKLKTPMGDTEKKKLEMQVKTLQQSIVFREKENSSMGNTISSLVGGSDNLMK